MDEEVKELRKERESGGWGAWGGLQTTPICREVRAGRWQPQRPGGAGKVQTPKWGGSLHFPLSSIPPYLCHENHPKRSKIGEGETNSHAHARPAGVPGRTWLPRRGLPGRAVGLFWDRYPQSFPPLLHPAPTPLTCSAAVGPFPIPELLRPERLFPREGDPATAPPPAPGHVTRPGTSLRAPESGEAPPPRSPGGGRSQDCTAWTAAASQPANRSSHELPCECLIVVGGALPRLRRRLGWDAVTCLEPSAPLELDGVGRDGGPDGVIPGPPELRCLLLDPAYVPLHEAQGLPRRRDPGAAPAVPEEVLRKHAPCRWPPGIGQVCCGLHGAVSKGAFGVPLAEHPKLSPPTPLAPPPRCHVLPEGKVGSPATLAHQAPHLIPPVPCHVKEALSSPAPCNLRGGRERARTLAFRKGLVYTRSKTATGQRRQQRQPLPNEPFGGAGKLRLRRGAWMVCLTTIIYMGEGEPLLIL
uniref:histone-lysine N-methyltransferase SETD1B-like n=1 Tax=Podarcis muralis TaxID=64176 RepID=UPI0010A054C1|nr:histone-lysine N-methyltransferase SETD1B-like [Podarcis muralis]